LGAAAPPAVPVAAPGMPGAAELGTPGAAAPGIAGVPAPPVTGEPAVVLVAEFAGTFDGEFGCGAGALAAGVAEPAAGTSATGRGALWLHPHTIPTTNSNDTIVRAMGFSK